MKVYKPIITALLAFFIVACASTKNIKPDLLYGLWKVAYIKNPDQIVTGAMMGNAQYEFTKEGQRIKTLNTTPTPPPESIAYKLDKNIISYPDNPKLPAVTVTKLSKDSLVLKSEKAEWHLYK